MTILDFIYYAGVFVFAVSGVISAARKDLDWVGATALALATSLGGGTFRDLVLQKPIFWVTDPFNIWTAIIASGFAIVFLRYFKPPDKSLRFFDAIGLAFFTILGAEITSDYHDSAIIIVLLSLFTGVLGGVIRDLLSNEVPYLFRSTETLYSVSALVGVVLYLLLSYFQVNTTLVSMISISSIIIIRMTSIHFNISLPSVKIKGEV